MQKLVKREELWRNCWDHFERLSFGEHLVASAGLALVSEQDDEVQLFESEANEVDDVFRARGGGDGGGHEGMAQAQWLLALRLVSSRQPSKPAAQ